MGLLNFPKYLFLAFFLEKVGRSQTKKMNECHFCISPIQAYDFSFYIFWVVGTVEHWIQIFVGSNNLIDEIAPHHLSSECFIILEDSPKANNVLNKFDFGIKYQVLPLPYHATQNDQN